MLINEDEQKAFRELLYENQKLMTENNQLLKMIHKRSVWAFWMNVFWYMVLFGVPFLLYFYVIEPYFTTFAQALVSMQDGLENVPGWSQFYSSIGGGGE